MRVPSTTLLSGLAHQNQLSRAALRAPTRICRDDALADLQSAQHELSRLIRCLQLQARKKSPHE